MDDGRRHDGAPCDEAGLTAGLGAEQESAGASPVCPLPPGPPTTGLRALVSRDFLRYLGPGFIVTVGFIDPGNWATNIAGGSEFGYELLWVLALATLMLILFQNMSARLGIATGHSLAYNVRRRFSRPWVALFGVSITLACIATDIAELLGGALGFNLLFGLPLWLGGSLTLVLKVGLIVLGRYHQIERPIVTFLALIAGAYLVEIILVDPSWREAARGVLVPRVTSASILVAMGMLGAVVMPHNIYLHSNVILSRDWAGDEARRRLLITYERADTALAMSLGWLVNSAMVIVAAAVFFQEGVTVTSIEQASATLEPLAGHLARLLFSMALLLAGLGSSITSSMAEANVVTAYLGRPEDPRSLFYRVSLLVTALPALAVVSLTQDSYSVLILSQVALSVQLPFTIAPLLVLARDRRVMGPLAAGRIEGTLGILAGILVVGLNVLLLLETLGGSF
jgi:manganese transport protein